MKNGPVRVGIIGSQFQADCHAAAMSMVPDDTSVVAVASPTAAHAQALADRYKIPRVYSDYKQLAQDPEVEAVTITAPNALHCEMTLAMAQAGKHVICEKPLCVTLDEADKMVEVACGPLNLQNNQPNRTAFNIAQFNAVSTQQLADNIETLDLQFNNLRRNHTSEIDTSMDKKFQFAERKYIQIRLVW